MESQFEARGIRTPFNEYDVFGYFIPGLTLVTLIYLYESCCLISINGNELEYIHAPVCHLLDRIREYLPSDSNWALATLFILSALSLLYVIGHVVASFSAIFIDRMLLYKGYGYPYEFLLDIKDKNRDIVSSMFYRGLFFWVNLVLFLIYYIETSWSKPNWLDEIVYSIIIMVVIVSIYKIIYSNAKRDFFKKRFPFLKYPFKFGRWFIINLFPLCYNLAASFLSNFIRTKRGFHEEYVKEYKELFNKVFNHKANDANTNNYWFSFLHICQKAPNLQKIASNWFHLYSFSRNISASFFLAYIYSTTWFHFQKEFILPNLLFAQVAPLGFFLCSFLLLIRYYYLYASYYSKFIFRAFIYIASLEK